MAEWYIINDVIYCNTFTIGPFADETLQILTIHIHNHLFLDDVNSPNINYHILHGNRTVTYRCCPHFCGISFTTTTIKYIDASGGGAQSRIQKFLRMMLPKTRNQVVLTARAEAQWPPVAASGPGPWGQWSGPAVHNVMMINGILMG